MTDPDNTSPETLQRGAAIGKQAGLRYIYAGNLPGEVGDLENTHCLECGELLIGRYGYFIREYRLTSEGACQRCGTAIPGRWAPAFQGQITAYPFLPRTRSSSLQQIANLSR